MDLQPHITALFLLSVIYFLLSGGGIVFSRVFLYYHYYDKLKNLKEQLGVKSPTTPESSGCRCVAPEREADYGSEFENSLSSYNDEGNTDSVKEFYCCTSNDTQLKELVDKWAQDTLRRITGNTVYGNVPPSALLVGRNSKNQRVNTSGHKNTITLWKAKYRNGLDIARGRLTLSVDGYYLVYSKVNLRSGVSDSVSHYTVVENEDDRPQPQTLMTSVADPCSPNSQDNTASHSSYHSGIHRLYSGDQISVKVSNAETTFVPEDSFFGIYLMSRN